MLERFRQWRFQKARDARDDLDDYLYKWRFGMRPSEIRRYERLLVEAQRKVNRLARPPKDGANDE